MLRVVIEVYEKELDPQGVKEELAMLLERYGKTRVTEVKVVREPDLHE